MDYCIASEQYPIAYELGKADLKTKARLHSCSNR